MQSHHRFRASLLFENITKHLRSISQFFFTLNFPPTNNVIAYRCKKQIFVSLHRAVFWKLLLNYRSFWMEVLLDWIKKTCYDQFSTMSTEDKADVDAQNEESVSKRNSTENVLEWTHKWNFSCVPLYSIVRSQTSIFVFFCNFFCRCCPIRLRRLDKEESVGVYV